jgi:ketosteroid isomerase-like protein
VELLSDPEPGQARATETDGTLRGVTDQIPYCGGDSSVLEIDYGGHRGIVRATPTMRVRTSVKGGNEMIRTAVPVLVCVAVAIAGCGTDPSSAGEEIRLADIEFDRSVADRDLEKFADLVDADAVFYGTRVLHGRDEVVESWSSLFAEDAIATLRWRPIAVEVARSGDLGYTRGEFEQTVRDEDGGVQISRGSYVSIWRKGQDGRWRAVLDIGTPPEPVEGVEAEK